MSVESVRYAPLPQETSHEQSRVCKNPLCGVLLSTVFGVSTGSAMAVLASSDNPLSGLTLGISATTGGFAGTTGAVVGKIAQKILADNNKFYLSSIAGSIGGLGFFLTAGNLLSFGLSNTFLRPWPQADFIMLGLVAGMLPLIFSKEGATHAAMSGGTLSLGVGAFTGGAIGGSFGSVLPEIGTFNGMLMGAVGGAVGSLCGYLVPGNQLPCANAPNEVVDGSD